MELRVINLFLLVLCIFLALSIFFPLNNLTGNIVKEDLGCEINGNFIDNVNLCCYEMQRFLECETNKCVNKNYEILFDSDLVQYCKKEGYDVRL